jgi:hypothetical protein
VVHQAHMIPMIEYLVKWYGDWILETTQCSLQGVETKAMPVLHGSC